MGPDRVHIYVKSARAFLNFGGENRMVVVGCGKTVHAGATSGVAEFVTCEGCQAYIIEEELRRG